MFSSLDGFPFFLRAILCFQHAVLTCKPFGFPYYQAIMASHVVGCQDMIIQGIIKPFFSHTIFLGEPFPKPSSHVLPSLVSTGMAPKKAPAQEVRTMATSFASKAMKTMKATNDHKKTMKASKDHNKTMKASRTLPVHPARKCLGTACAFGQR